MSYKVKCDECQEEVDIRGYSGHLRMKHAITGQQMRELVEKKKAYVPPSRETGTPTQETDGYSHASQVSAAAKARESDRLGAVCTMCGRSDDVHDASNVADLFSQRGYRVPDELHEYDHFCMDCEYAFGGENDE